MSKKTSLSIHCKQHSLIHIQDQTISHSLSRKKHYLTVVTPSQHQPKRIKTLKQIKRIAQGIKTTSIQPQPEIPLKTQVVQVGNIPSFHSESSSWRRNLTLDLKPFSNSEKYGFQWSGRTMDTRMQGSQVLVPQTPINRLI